MNTIVEQDHRQVKRHHNSALGYKTKRTARITIAGIEAVHMLKKGQVQVYGTTFGQTFCGMFGA